MYSVVSVYGGEKMQKQKFEIKSDRASLWLDGYTKDILEQLMSTGDFKSISQLLQIAVINLYKDYEAQGKLKPRRPAEDIAEEIEQGKHKPIRKDHIGEEVIR
jgi:Arc/MetJ-type ribon-helix-helix transcriptional regulator